MENSPVSVRVRIELAVNFGIILVVSCSFY
jgi:hypothetical protein